MALTSSVLFAAGTTPWPAGTGGVFLTPTSKPVSVAPGKNPSTAHLSNEIDSLTVVGMMRRQHRLNEVHYAVANNTLAPILQDRAINQALKKYSKLHRRQTEQKEHKVSPPTSTAKTRPKRLTSRSGSISITQTDDALGMQIAKLALSLVGTPYQWGGESTHGFDCSGLTEYVFRQAGIVLPRTSYEQFQVGTAVSRSTLHPGDLVFFTTDRRGPSHVAIYVGNGLIVHALNESKGVIVSRLSDSYYAGRYIGARRYGH